MTSDAMREAPSKEQRMYDALKRIAHDYQTPAQLRRSCSRDYGLAAQEAIEMAYENIQGEAKSAIKGVRRPEAKT